MPPKMPPPEKSGVYLILLGGGNSHICLMFTPDAWGNDPC